jgi:ribosome-associated protein YbcJ (S4-like RNA binding protein)
MEEQIQSTENQSLVKKFSDLTQKSNLKGILLPAGIILGIILAGGVTGWALANRSILISGPTETKQLTGGAQLIQGPKEVGIKDVKTFRDTAEGKITVNDKKEIPEGSHKLLRLGGPSQTAYLTSSVIDLNQFLGKCVQVWGETFAGQKAGWLMDIGRVKILDSCPKGI